MRNRSDSLKVSPGGEGVACNWEYTRTLHICDVFPFTGRWLLRRAMHDYPIRLQDRPAYVNEQQCCSNQSLEHDVIPEISFLIGHRGLERLSLLSSVLRSVAAQCEITFEVIVVDQDAESRIKEELPEWVRYIHDPCAPQAPYNRSRTMNIGAGHARAALLILQDNDLLVPKQYGAEVLARCKQGYEVVNLKRFIFYRAAPDSGGESVEDECQRMRVESVLQNAKGGGTVAIQKSAFREIGGMDEDFVGWGGEDVEFWGRCLTRKVWGYGMMPIVHLWHPAQPGKRAKRGLGEHTADLTEARLAMSAQDRIDELVNRAPSTPVWSRGD